jgi:basic membrane lipoprotein Med (substrate-binding protein (PBP1-ABC) superfamily)/DNA-binding SARP family transcriptional activator
VEFRVLGPVEVLHEGRAVALGGPKQRAVLAVLLLQVNHLVSSEALIDALWGEEPPETARNTLQGYVSHLRQALGNGRLEGRPPGYVLHAAPEEVDALRFNALTHEARGILEDDPTRAASLLSEALALWRGPALADILQDPAVSGEAARLEESRLTALEDRIDADLALGRHAQLVGELEALIDRHALRERLWSQLMVALYGAGRQADALRAYQRLHALLSEELGLDPSPPLVRLQERILLHDASLVPKAGREPSAPTRNPFKGLRPFDEEDSDDFFGREELAGRLVDGLRDGQRLLALVGPSGSGKSSVVNAGLIPALRAEWAVARMVPGKHPFEELGAALRTVGVDHPDTIGGHPPTRPLALTGPEGRRLLLVVDQFEELFGVSEEADQAPFLAALTAAASDPEGQVTIVLTLRGDFYDRPLLHATFAPLFIEGVVTVLPMSAEEIERAVVGPARRVGVEVDPALLADLIADTTDQPNALPLLQYALTEMFDRRIGASLTSEAYRALGGLHGTLSRRAEDLYGHLDDQQRNVAFQVFLRLVRLGQKAGDSSRRVAVGELTALGLDPVALSDVLEAFGRHRLVTFDRDPVTGDATVQVAHEALLTKWERLANWIERHRSDLARHESFVRAIDEWEAAGRNPDYLLTGSRLAEYEDWSRDTTLQLTDQERAFLDTGLARQRDEHAREVAQLDQRRRLERSARTRLIALVVAVAMVLGAVTIGTVTWLEGRPADAVLVFVGRGTAGLNDALAAGFDRAVSELGVRGEEVITHEDQFQTEYQRLSEEGVDLVVGWGADCGFWLEPIAADHPDTRYFMLDCLGELPPNVSEAWFATEEGSFLAGAAAALTTRTGIVGFIGGVDLPLIWPFHAGFEAGARYIDPTIDVTPRYLTEAPDLSGFGSPRLASDAADQMYRDGADVIYHAAGFAGVGVFEAAASQSEAQHRQLWAIGVDTDQYESIMDLSEYDPASLRPHILTSMVKRYDRVTYAGLEEYSRGEFSPGVSVFGLAEGGVDIAYSGDFIDDIRPTIEDLRAQIIAGEIDVPSIPADKEDEVANWPPELIPP